MSGVKHRTFYQTRLHISDKYWAPLVRSSKNESTTAILQYSSRHIVHSHLLLSEKSTMRWFTPSFHSRAWTAHGLAAYPMFTWMNMHAESYVSARIPASETACPITSKHAYIMVWNETAVGLRDWPPCPPPHTPQRPIPRYVGVSVFIGLCYDRGTMHFCFRPIMLFCE